jgi:ATP-binding cassette subfamily C protein CydD
MNLDRRLLHLAGEARIPLGLAVAFGLLGGIATILQALFLSQAIDLAFLRRGSPGELSGLMALLLSAVAVRAALSGMREAAACRAAIRVKARLRERLLAHLLKLGPAHARGERTGELINTVTEGIEALDGYFSQYLPSLALAALVPTTILLFVFPLDLLSGIVFLVTAPLIPLFTALIGKMAERLTRRQWDSMSRMSAHFLDVLQGLTTLKLFGRSRDETRRVERISLRFRDATMGVLRVAFLSALALELLATVSTAIIAVEVGLRLLYGDIGFQRALFVLILAPEFYLPLRNLGLRFHAGMSGVTAGKQILAVLACPSPSNAAEGHPSLSQPAALPAPVRFESVSYTYPDADQPALENVSFTLLPGQQMALVGVSGAGKSTLASLLLRLIEPQNGEIWVAGRPLRSISRAAWRDQIAWAPQAPHIFHDTLAANLRLARPHAGLDELRAAARLAHLDEWIQTLPQGYDTIVGESGARLSSGQAQRLALARAFLKDAPLLVLDEPTASLDPELEAHLAESTRRLRQGRSVLVIAHRLETIASSDAVIVLDKGRLVASGLPAELRNAWFAGGQA